MRGFVIGATSLCAGVVLAIVGMLLVGELRDGPRLMPASAAAAYEKWCGEEKGGQTHYNAKRHITSCTVPPKAKQ